MDDYGKSLTVADFERLRRELLRMRADGILKSVDQNGESLEFKSDAQLASAMRAVEAEIESLRGTKPTTITFSTSKGL